LTDNKKDFKVAFG